MSDADFDAIGLLQDPARRSLYAYVVAQGREVSRNEAAEGIGMPRTLAAFHLDRLANAGLLDVAFRRLTARSGPGAGRPAKVYRRPLVEHAVSLPPRDYASAANVFAEAIERSGAEAVLYDAARARGLTAGKALARAPACSGLTPEDLQRELTVRGYEPYQSDVRLRLRNCPFRAVAQEFPVVACGMNVALLEGLLEGGGLSTTHAVRLEPTPGECCVVIALKKCELT